jgi:hypothetical protein
MSFRDNPAAQYLAASAIRTDKAFALRVTIFGVSREKARFD